MKGYARTNGIEEGAGPVGTVGRPGERAPTLARGAPRAGLALVVGLALGAALEAGFATGSLRAQEPFPTEPPPPLPAEDVRFPAVVHDTLENGLELVVIENHEQPVVSVRLYLPAGEVADPEGRTGVANLTASVLDKGTPTRSAEEIAATVEGVGASLDVGADDDDAFVSVTTLTRHLPTVLEVMADVVRNATFPEERFANEKRRMLSSLRVELGQPGALASRQFRARVYGPHPYGAEPTLESVEAIGVEDLRAFHAERYRPDGSLLIFAGDIEAGEARSAARRWFGDWTGSAPTDVERPAPPPPGPTDIYLVHRPGSVQTNIWLGHLGLRPGHEDAYALDVMNRVLGGGANARLFLILREEKGWTYGAYSRLTSPAGPGYFAATAEVRTPVTDSALAEMLHQVGRIREERVPAGELADAKNFLTGSFPLRIETPSQVATRVADVLLRGLGIGWLESYRSRIEAVEAADVQRVARAHLRPDSSVIVLVGDATQILEKVERFGPVTLLDEKGAELAREDLEVRRSDVSLDASRLPLGRHTYDLVVQDRKLGQMALTVEREGENYRVTETLSGMMGNQTTRYVFGPELRPVSSSQEGQLGPIGMNMELSYGPEGRVTGTATVPERGAAGGMETREVRVDTTLEVGTLDQQMALAAVMAAPLAPGLTFELPVYSPRAGVTQLTVTVTGEGEVTVPAGSYRTYTLSLDMADQGLELQVTRGTPHLVVRQELRGQPVIFELVSSGETGAGGAGAGGAGAGGAGAGGAGAGGTAAGGGGPGDSTSGPAGATRGG